MPYEITYQEVTPLIGNPITVSSESASIDIQPVKDGSTYKITVVAINSIGIRSAAVVLPLYTVLGKTLPPNNIQGFSVVATKYGNYVSWQANTDIDLLGYEVRKGSSWALGTILQEDTTSTSFTDVNLYPGTNTYWAAAVDTSGNYSSTPVTSSISVPAPLALSLSYTIVGTDYIISWVEPSSVYAIDKYEIRTGTSWADGILLTTTKTTSLQNPVTWNNLTNFHIAAIDIARNYSIPTTVGINISAPISTSITSQVVDNNVLLYWTDAKATLPITFYEIRRGVTYSSATIIGTKAGLFTTLFETTAGTYTYWITGIDSAGNYGNPASALITVNTPPDYILTNDYNSIFNGTFSNAAIDIDDLSMPHNLTETWTTHFTTGAHTGKPWSTPQDQINAGYPVFGQPTLSSGYYEETIDYGVVLAGTKITVLLDTLGTVGTPVTTVTISTKLNSGDAWTSVVGVTELFTTNFRYAKVKVAATSDGTSILNIRSINIKLDSKLKNEAGMSDCVSTDTGGTQVNFNVPFIDIASITATLMGTAANISLVVDFTDVPNPTSFKILLFNSAGNRVSGTVSWSAKGY